MKYVSTAFAVALICTAAPAVAAEPMVCRNCPPPRHYDSQETIRTTRTIDRSRVINTTSVVYRAVPQIVVVAPPPVVVNYVVQRYVITHYPNSDAVRVIYPVAPRFYRPVAPHCRYMTRDGRCVRG
jgi:hypothetical protein